VDLTASPPARWAILGGTFDPIHDAHLAIAEQARHELGVAGVVFVPARLPPHKLGQSVTDAAHRLRMVQLAVAEHPAFRVDDLELRRSGPSYTVDTAEELAPRLGPEPWFILSVETLRLLPAWHRPHRLLELVRMAVVPRAGVEPPDGAWYSTYFPGREGRFRVLQGPRLPHASSEIRRLVADGRPIDHLVSRAVERYIREHGLYGPAIGEAVDAGGPPIDRRTHRTPRTS